MNVFSYNSRDHSRNVGQLVKSGDDYPSVFVDFANGLISSAITISTVSAVSVGSTNATNTSTLIGTTAISGSVARLDLMTGGTSGTGTASNGDRSRVTMTATLSSGGPLEFVIFVNIHEPTYGP